MYVFLVLKRVLGKVHFKETVRLYMYVYLVLKACARESTLQRSSQALHICILRSKSVCTTHFAGIATAKTSRLYMHVYLVLSDCAQKLPRFRKEGGVGKAVDEVLKPPFTPVVSISVNGLQYGDYLSESLHR